MKKRDIIIAGLSFVAALLIMGGGLLLHNHHSHTLSNDGPSSANNDQVSSTLSVGSGSANNLGQINNQSSNSSGASSSSNSNSGPDPSTFGQYDKYKNDKNALFGDVQAGNGAALAAGKTASIIYKGWLTNGQLFDASKTGNDGKLQPFVFVLGSHSVIPGMEQGIDGMKAGGTRLIIVPPAVGYGSQAQSSIPPNSVLIFQVQLQTVQ
jgi:FKBP-type peptidyl-prolyl cis-trans isomerase